MTEYHAGRHFLQIPGPTNVPDRVLRAIDNPTIDHRGPAFGRMGMEVLTTSARSSRPPAGGDLSGLRHRRVGGRADQYAVARRHGADVPHRLVRHAVEGDGGAAWPGGRCSSRPTGAAAPTSAAIEAALAADKAHAIKAVCVVHNETSTGCARRIDEVRRAIDAAGHPALLLVDTISSLASIDYRHDEWGVDVTVAGCQKGLMLPPGLSFNAISEKALKAAEAAKLPRSYWDWRPMLEANKTGYFPYTPGDESAVRPE